MEVDNPIVCSQVSGRIVRFSGMRLYIAGWTSLGILKENIAVSSMVLNDSISSQSPKSLTVPLWVLQTSTNIKHWEKFYDKIVSFTIRFFFFFSPSTQLSTRSFTPCQFYTIGFPKYSSITLYMLEVFSVCAVVYLFVCLWLFRDIISNSENVVLTDRVFQK